MDIKDPTPSFIGVVIPEASDSRSEVVQFTPRRAVETKVGVSYFGCWKGMRWNLWLLPLLDPLILSPVCDRFMLRKRLHQFNRRLRKRLCDLRRGLVFRHTKLLLKTSISAYFKASRRVAAFRRTEAAAMSARLGKYCLGVDFRHAVIVRKAEFIATSTSFVFLLLDHTGEQYSAAGYTRARLLVLSVLMEAPHPVPASRFNSAKRDKTLCRTGVRCGLKVIERLTKIRWVWFKFDGFVIHWNV